MRKNTETATTGHVSVPPVKKTTAMKKPRTRPNKKRAAAIRPDAKNVPVTTNNLLVDMDNETNSASGTERSTSPTESDLLLYLTAHITPPKNEIYGYTVFSIDTAEYLRGVVRLIHSDCPEIGIGIDSFLSSMARAFVDVTNPGVVVGEVSYTASDTGAYADVD
jgi:hypothetical protein